MIETLKPFYHKLLMPIAGVFIAAKIHPDVITLLGACISAVAAWHIGRGAWFLGAVFLGASVCMDGLDGLVAVKSGKQSRFGAVLDSSIDRITEILWFFSLLFFYTTKYPANHAASYLAAIAMSGSLMVSYVRARCEGANVPCKEGLLQRPERTITLIVCLILGPVAMRWGLLALSLLSYGTVIQRLFIARRFCKKNK